MFTQTNRTSLVHVPKLKSFITAAILLLPTLLYAADWIGGVKKPSATEMNGKTFYEIESAENLAWFATQVNKGNADYNAILKNDIAITSAPASTETIAWTPIGIETLPYTGIFDGAGHTISGFFSKEKNAGLFGFIGKGSVVKNLNLSNALVRGVSGNAGLLAASFAGDSIVNVRVSGTVFADSLAGGLAGEFKGNNTILRTTSEAQVASNIYAGGFVGKVKGFAYFEESISNGKLDSAANTGSAGGFIGYVEDKAFFYNDTNLTDLIAGSTQKKPALGGFVAASKAISTSSFTNCLNKGRLYGVGDYDYDYAAGFIGHSEGHVSIFSSVNEGSIEHAYYGGGFVGRIKGSRLIVQNSSNKGYMNNLSSGGIVSYIYTNSYANITHTSNNAVLRGAFDVGGIVATFYGDSLLISKCSNADSLYGGSKNVGGILAYGADNSSKNKAYIAIENCVNEGHLNGGNAVGGIIGYNSNRLQRLPNAYVKNVQNYGNISVKNARAAGGIVGLGDVYNEGAYIDNSENMGEIHIVLSDAYSSDENRHWYGGVAGVSGNIFNSNNKGKILVESDNHAHKIEIYVGGITASSDSVQYCKNQADVAFVGQTKGRETPLYINVVGIATFAKGLLRYNINEGRISADVGSMVHSVDVAGIYAGGSVTSGPVIGANINKGRVILNSEKELTFGGAWAAYARNSSVQRVEAGTYSLTDSVAYNGVLVPGNESSPYKAKPHVYYNKDLMPVENDTLPELALTTAEMQSEKFAWMLNSHGNTTSGTGLWSQHGNDYPVFADENNHAIYKVTFLDSSKVLSIYTYKIDSSYTNYRGNIIKMPEEPDPTDGDEDLKFGYWGYGDRAITKESIINGDYKIYAMYIPQSSKIGTLSFQDADGNTVASYVVSDNTQMVTLPEAPQKEGHNFIGWFNGNQLVGLPGELFEPGATTVLKAKYEAIKYKITFASGMVLLQTDSIAYGEVPAYRGKTPSCSISGFEFSGWLPAISAVTKDVEYSVVCASVASSSSSSDVSSSSEKLSSSSEAVSSSSEKLSSSSEAASSSSEKLSSSSEAVSSSSEKLSSSSEAVSSSSQESELMTKALAQSKFNVTVNNMTIMLTNAHGDVVRIYDMLGHLIVQKSLSGTSMNITLKVPGNYIVNMNGSSHRVTLR